MVDFAYYKLLFYHKVLLRRLKKFKIKYLFALRPDIINSFIWFFISRQYIVWIINGL